MPVITFDKMLARALYSRLCARLVGYIVEQGERDMIAFAEALKEKKLLLFDGATGTQLAARGGVPGGVSNLQYPELVKAVHGDYKNAGSNIILTNTLTANRIALEHAGMVDKLEDINALGAKLAREAAGNECYVLGDMSSTGKFMEPLGDYTEQQFYDNAAEQAKILAANGVDGIIVETMTDVRETCIAVKAAKNATGLPVIASISFDPVGDSFRTMMGDTPEKAVKELTEAGADGIGSNCGTIDPIDMSKLMIEMRSFTSGILAAEPNAGKPQVVGGEVRFDLSPQDFAEGVLKCIEAGATLVGGCCGTTPAHIAELARRIK